MLSANTGWHVPRVVPYAVVFGIIVQGAFIFMNVENNTRSIKKLVTETTSRAILLARLQQGQLDILRAIDRIDRFPKK